jgi:hypothetical protein
VFHPNIAPHAICVGDHWSAGESLRSIITRIGEMLAYQSYNVKSPLNGEAARWVEQNKDRVPLDRVSLLVEEETNHRGETMNNAAQSTTTQRSSDGAVPPVPRPSLSGVSRPSARPPAPAASTAQRPVGQPISAPKQVACPNCSKTYPFTASLLGKPVRCSKCQHVFEYKVG